MHFTTDTRAVKDSYVADIVEEYETFYRVNKARADYARRIPHQLFAMAYVMGGEDAFGSAARFRWDNAAEALEVLDVLPLMPMYLFKENGKVHVRQTAPKTEFQPIELDSRVVLFMRKSFLGYMESWLEAWTPDTEGKPMQVTVDLIRHPIKLNIHGNMSMVTTSYEGDKARQRWPTLVTARAVTEMTPGEWFGVNFAAVPNTESVSCCI